MATLLRQRQSIIAEWGITTAAETMLVDLAVVHYALALRVQGWIGDLAVRIEHEFFGDSSLCAGWLRMAWKVGPGARGGYEGYVAKDEASPYIGGITRAWLKVKVPGWTDPEDRWRRQQL
jgi:hypothetical protein